MVLKASGGRAPTITVKIKPDDSLSFQLSRHKKRVMTLLALNILSMHDSLARLLWQLSEAGEPAVMLGRQHTAEQDALPQRLLALGVLALPSGAAYPDPQ